MEKIKITTSFLFFFAFCLGFQTPSFAQTELKGIVKDSLSGKPIIGANILVMNTSYGTVSNTTGYFQLPSNQLDSTRILRISYIGYVTKYIHFKDFNRIKEIFLVPDDITLDMIKVEAQSLQSSYQFDITSSVKLLNSESYKNTGAQDVADILKSHNEIQIEESSPTKRTISLRGGNTDEVLVFFNGLKLNNLWTNEANIAFIQSDIIERIEIIKGSNTTVYGADAFSGVINFVPVLKMNETAKFSQQIGSYESGNWSLSINNQVLNDRINQYLDSDFIYQFNQNGQKRYYLGSPSPLETFNESHFFNFRQLNSTLGGELNFTAIHAYLEKQNPSDDENLKSADLSTGLGYKGLYGWLEGIDISLKFREVDEDHLITLVDIPSKRSILQNQISVHLLKSFTNQNYELLFGYQGDFSILDFRDEWTLNQLREGIIEGDFSKNQNAWLLILKTRTASNSDFLNVISVDLSARYDQVNNSGANILENTNNNESNWQNNIFEKVTYKISSSISGTVSGLSVQSFFNYGRNIKFPSLLQQLSQAYFTGNETSETSFQNNLIVPEENSSVEIGMLIGKSGLASTLNSFNLGLNYFQNNYSEKIRTIYKPGIQIPFFDNVPDVSLKGIETTLSYNSFDSHLNGELGISFYSISDKAAFPFKSSFKINLNHLLNLGQMDIGLNIFHEGEQVGWSVRPSGDLIQIKLPSFSNLDVQTRFKFSIGDVSGTLSGTVRNLLDTKSYLEGLAIRERQFYLGFSVSI